MISGHHHFRKHPNVYEVTETISKPSVPHNCGILIMDSRVREPNVYTVDLLQAYTSLENLHETHNKLGAGFLSIYHLAIWQ